MTKRLMILLLLGLIVQLSFSQIGYPRKIVFERDTLILITPAHLVRINQNILKCEMLEKLSFKLDSINYINNQQLRIYFQLDSINNLTSIALEQKSRLYKEALACNEKRVKKLERSLKISHKAIIFCSIGSLIVGILLK